MFANMCIFVIEIKLVVLGHNFSLGLDREVKIKTQMLPLLFREYSGNSAFLYEADLRHIVAALWLNFFSVTPCLIADVG